MSESPVGLNATNPPATLRQRIRHAIEVGVVMLVGLAAVVLPSFLYDERGTTSSYFPVVFTAVERLSRAALGLLFLIGLAIGLLIPSRAIRLAFCTMASFPALVIVDTILTPGSHNLMPFEFAIYFGVSLVAVLGAVVGRALRRCGVSK